MHSLFITLPGPMGHGSPELHILSPFSSTQPGMALVIAWSAAIMEKKRPEVVGMRTGGRMFRQGSWPSHCFWPFTTRIDSGMILIPENSSCQAPFVLCSKDRRYSCFSFAFALVHCTQEPELV